MSRPEHRPAWMLSRAPSRDETKRAVKALALGAILGLVVVVLARRGPSERPVERLRRGGDEVEPQGA